MSAGNSTAEEDLEEAFRIGPEFGLTLLHEDFQEVLLRCIKGAAWSLSAEERLDVYQETMLAMIGEARKADFDPHRPLRLAQTIAHRRAIDYLRAKGHRANTNTDAVLPHVAAGLKNTDLGFEWRSLGPADWKEFRKALAEVIATLTERQRIVAQAYVDHYEDFKERGTYLPLAEAVGRVTGRRENVAAVKSAWVEASRKIVCELTRRGFDYLDRGES